MVPNFIKDSSIGGASGTYAVVTVAVLVKHILC
jgi:hypothetical protein